MTGKIFKVTIFYRIAEKSLNSEKTKIKINKYIYNETNSENEQHKNHRDHLKNKDHRKDNL